MRLWLVIGSSVGALMLYSGAIAGQMPPQGTPAAGDKAVSVPQTPTNPALADTIAQVAVVTQAVAQIASTAVIVPTAAEMPANLAAPASVPSKDAAAAPRRAKDNVTWKAEKTKSDKVKRREELAAAGARPMAVRCVGKPETGTAAWYGGRYIGRRTTSGERLDTTHLTAAHRTLPLNSLARVTNLHNGRSVVVRVTDRGPVADSLLIDMSPRAAAELNMKEAGLAPVRVEQVVEVPADAVADAKYFF
jgi:rare lipoprotein A (peptidoglycan hydrolase)